MREVVTGCQWSTHHPTAIATTTVIQNKSRRENRIRLRRLYFMGEKSDIERMIDDVTDDEE